MPVLSKDRWETRRTLSRERGVRVQGCRARLRGLNFISEAVRSHGEFLKGREEERDVGVGGSLLKLRRPGVWG